MPPNVTCSYELMEEATTFLKFVTFDTIYGSSEPTQEFIIHYRIIRLRAFLQ